MKEYIKRSDIFPNGVFFVNENNPLTSLDELIKRIWSLPAADVVERKRGEWIEKPFLLGTSNFCSLCDSFYGMPHGKFNFCPNCGADMREVDHEN